MRRFQYGLLAAVAVFGFASIASAADMAVKAPVVAPFVAYNWTGFYIGGNVGGAWSKSDWQTDATTNGTFVPVSHSASSFIGGGQLGYRYQFMGNWVVGIEGMYDWARLDKNEIAPNLPPTRYRSTDIKSIYSITGQWGYASNNWLAYLKGGWAGARTELGTLNANNGVTSSVSGQAHGWTGGVGVDYMVTRNWIVGVVFDYYDLKLGDTSTTQTNGNPATFTGEKSKIYSIAFRLNYKFDWVR